ncbi:MAG: TetR/AcrR family transcriptional regulator [Pseudobdellovibrionaceae bacterium]|nr:TetR/AcrR family transcriptional regulator [Pseudobdellovibrionaceae bacterium]
MTKQYHHGDLREALIDATLEMLKNDEAHLIGFRELARRLDVSRAAPYRHFESVESLLGFIAEEGYRKFIEALEPVALHGTLGSKERFLELGIVYVNFALKNSAHYRLMFDQRFFKTGTFPKVEQLAAQAFGLLKLTASACLPADAAPDEKNQLANLAWASVHGISKLFIDGQWDQVQDRQKFIRYACEKLVAIV